MTGPMTRAVLLLALLLTGPTYAEPRSADARCARVQNVPFPADDRPTEAQKTSLKGCDSEDLYYGITGKADPVKARLCAYTQVDSRTK